MVALPESTAAISGGAPAGTVLRRARRTTNQMIPPARARSLPRTMPAARIVPKKSLLPMPAAAGEPGPTGVDV